MAGADDSSGDVPRLITAFFDELSAKGRSTTPLAPLLPESSVTRSFKDALMQSYKDGLAAHSAQLASQADVDPETTTKALETKADASALFGDNLSEGEQEMLKQRLAAQQKQMQDLERKRLGRKTRMIRGMYPFLTQREGELALKSCGGDEDDAATKLTSYDFLHEVRKQVALEQNKAVPRVMPISRHLQVNIEGCVAARNRKVGEVAKKTRYGEGFKRVRLDDALARAEQGDTEGWSEARLRAYALIDKNPNAYYYRFNPPGQQQRNGKWTKDVIYLATSDIPSHTEQDLFMERMKEVGVDGNWGVFSMTIPGRVGYQCSNFYRFLIQQGKVKDPNYVLDDRGKVHYLFSKGVRKTAQRVASGDFPDQVPRSESPPKKKQAKRKKKEENDDGDSDDGTYHCSSKATEELFAKKKEANPLPGFIDPISAEEVEDPYISPYGHVMGKTTWSRCLAQEPKNTCPFTKQHIHKRDLVALTWENIVAYRDKIKTVVS